MWKWLVHVGHQFIIINHVAQHVCSMMLAVLASKEPEGIFFVYQKSQHRVTPQGIVKIAGSPTIARNATEKRAQKRPQKRAQKQTNGKIMPDFPLLILILLLYIFMFFIILDQNRKMRNCWCHKSLGEDCFGRASGRAFGRAFGHVSGCAYGQ